MQKKICIIFRLHGITIFETNSVKKSAYLSKNVYLLFCEICNFKTEILFASGKEFNKQYYLPEPEGVVGFSQQSYAESGKSEGQLFVPQTRFPAQSLSDWQSPSFSLHLWSSLQQFHSVFKAVHFGAEKENVYIQIIPISVIVLDKMFSQNTSKFVLFYIHI